MEDYNIARIVFTIITLLVAVGLFLLRKFVYKDEETEQKVTIEKKGKDGKIKSTKQLVKLVQKKNYERRIVDVVNIAVCWYVFLLGVAQPWQWIVTSAFLGTCALFLGILIPPLFFGGGYLGFTLQKNDFDWLLILDPDVESKVFKIKSAETFIKEGIKYIKAETLKDAMNENFTAIIIDVQRERFWKAHLDDIECEPVFADDMKITSDKIEIATFIRGGGVITTELLDSTTEREIHRKDSLSEIIKEQELVIMDQEDLINYLGAQRKKGIIEKTAEKIAVFFKLFDDIAGLSAREEHKKDTTLDTMDTIVDDVYEETEVVVE